MKKYSVITLMAIMLLLIMGAKAQIKNEIESFVDSSDIILKNGRKLIAKSLLSGDNEKATEVYKFLNNYIKDNNSSAFSYTEHLTICLLLEDWDALLDNMEHANKKVKLLSNPSLLSDKLDELLFNKIKSQYDEILTDVNSSVIDNEGKKAIKLLLYIAKVNYADKKYSSMKKEYKREFKTSKYSFFVKNYLPAVKFDLSISWDIGGGVFVPIGSFSDYFTSVGGFGMGMSVNMDHSFVALFMSGANTYARKEFYGIADGQNVTLSKDEDFNVLNIGGKVGYYLVKTERLKIAPEFLCSAFSVQTNRYKAEDKKKEIRIIDSFAYGAGLHCEFKIMDYKSYYYSYYTGYMGLKLDAEYSQLAKVPDSSFSGGAMFVNLSFVFGLGEF